MENNKFIQFINENKGPIATFFALFLAGYAGAMALNTQFLQSPVVNSEVKPDVSETPTPQVEQQKQKEIIETLVAKEAHLQQGQNLASKYSKLLTGSAIKAAPTNQFIESLKNGG